MEDRGLYNRPTWLLILVAALRRSIWLLLLGELWFRLPWTTKLAQWEFDDELVAKLAAPQSRGIGLGNFSALSEPMAINRNGFRNGAIDWTQPAILAVGSSELLGPGVEDHEVWTAIVSDRLSRATGGKITVVNAGSGGYGPYNHAVQVRSYPWFEGTASTCVVPFYGGSKVSENLTHRIVENLSFL